MRIENTFNVFCSLLGLYVKSILYLKKIKTFSM